MELLQLWSWHCSLLHCTALSPPNPSVFQAHLTSIPTLGFPDLSSFILHFENFSYQAPSLLRSRFSVHPSQQVYLPFGSFLWASICTEVFAFLTGLHVPSPSACSPRPEICPSPTSADPGSQDIPTSLQHPLLPSDCRALPSAVGRGANVSSWLWAEALGLLWQQALWFLWPRVNVSASITVVFSPRARLQ